MGGELHERVHLVEHVLEGAVQDGHIPDSGQTLELSFVVVHHVEKAAVGSREAGLESKKLVIERRSTC